MIAMKECNKCHYLNEDQAAFCTKCGEPFSSREWYYAQYGQPIGPVSDARFQELVENGTIVDQTYIWTKGWKDWIHYYESDVFQVPAFEHLSELKKEWFYLEGYDRKGPFSKETMIQLMQEGKIDKNTYVWKSGLKDWTALKDSELLFFPKLPKEEKQSTEWFYIEDGKPKGPISEKQLVQMVQKQELLDTAYIWKYGLKDWIHFNESELMFFPKMPQKEVDILPFSMKDQKSPQWYYAKGKKQYGPYSQEKFNQLVEEGIIGPSTYIWNDEMDEWQTYQEQTPEKNWYYGQNGQSVGPITQTQLSNYLKDGTLSSQTYVWCEGMDDWEKVQDIPELHL